MDPHIKRNPAKAMRIRSATADDADSIARIHLPRARLALGELERKSGRARLLSLEEDARALGFGLVARNAAARR